MEVLDESLDPINVTNAPSRKKVWVPQCKY